VGGHASLDGSPGSDDGLLGSAIGGEGPMISGGSPRRFDSPVSARADADGLQSEDEEWLEASWWGDIDTDSDVSSTGGGRDGVAPGGQHSQQSGGPLWLRG